MEIESPSMLNMRALARPSQLGDHETLYVGDVFGIATGFADRTNLDGDSVAGLAGWFEIRRETAFKRKIKNDDGTMTEHEFFVAISKRFFPPAPLTKIIRDQMKALGTEKTLADIEFGYRVSLVKSEPKARYAFDPVITPRAADPLALLRTAHDEQPEKAPAKK